MKHVEVQESKKRKESIAIQIQKTIEKTNIQQSKPINSDLEVMNNKINAFQSKILLLTKSIAKRDARIAELEKQANSESKEV